MAGLGTAEPGILPRIDGKTAMCAPRFRLLLLGVGVALAGCGWFPRRANFDRDPLVQSHLMNRRDTAGLAANERGPGNDSVLQSTSSTARKPRPSRDRDFGQGWTQPWTAPREEPRHGFDPDFRWLRGRLVQRSEPADQWYLRYSADHPAGMRQASATGGDPFGGEIRLAYNPRLNLLRTGDVINVEGQLATGADGAPMFVVQSFTLLQP